MQGWRVRGMGRPLLFAKHCFDPFPLEKVRVCLKSRKMFSRCLVRSVGITPIRSSILLVHLLRTYMNIKVRMSIETNEYMVRRNGVYVKSTGLCNQFQVGERKEIVL